MYKPIKMTHLKIVSSLVFFGITLSIIAQDGTNDSKMELGALITDRPDATESPNTVPQGFLQIETGAYYTSFEDMIEGNTVKEEAIGYNTTLLRYGVLENLEVRLGWNFEEGQTTVNGTKLMNVSSGFTPLLAGMKVEISEEKGWMPTIGLLAHLFLPVSAGADYKPDTTGANILFSFSHTLSDSSGIGYNLGAKWGDDSPQVAYVYTIAFGQSLVGDLSFYAELYGDLPENDSSNHFWDAGFTYLLTDDIQLDATIGSGITEGQDLLLSGGISYRIQKKK